MRPDHPWPRGRAHYEWAWLGVLIVSLLSAATGKAAEVWFKWRANSELGIAGYYLHHGPTSRGYTNRVEVGLTTNCVLELSGRQFVAVTAFNYLGWESEMSAELMYEPLMVIAERSIDGGPWRAVSTNEVAPVEATELWKVRIERVQ
jgi:hypothetical protein